MSQIIILENLKKYAAIIYKDLDPKLYKEIMKTNALCFGLSVYYAIMELAGYRVAWENALAAAYNWDGEEATLNMIIELEPERKISLDLDNIFAIIANFIPSIQSPSSADLTQENFFDLMKKVEYFDFLAGGNSFLTIEKKITLSGTFTKNQLSDLLKNRGEAVAKSLFLIHSLDHTTQASYDSTRNSWNFYNSNFEHDSNNISEKELTTEDFIDSFVRYLHETTYKKDSTEDQDDDTHTLTFEIVLASTPEQLNKQELMALKEPQQILLDSFFDNYLKILKEDCKGLISKEGFLIICRHSSYVVPEIFQLAETDHKTKVALRTAVLIECPAKRTSFHELAIFKPELLPRLIAIMPNLGFYALQQLNKSNMNPLYLVSIHNPAKLIPLCNEIIKTLGRKEAIDFTLTQYCRGNTAIQELAIFVNSKLEQKLPSSMTAKELKSVEEITSYETESGYTVMSELKNSPEIFPLILEAKKLAANLNIVSNAEVTNLNQPGEKITNKSKCEMEPAPESDSTTVTDSKFLFFNKAEEKMVPKRKQELPPDSRIDCENYGKHLKPNPNPTKTH